MYQSKRVRRKNLIAFAKTVIKELNLTNNEVMLHLYGGKKLCPGCNGQHFYTDRFCPECGISPRLESNRLYAEYRKRGLNSHGIINSYALGFVRGLKAKLDAQSISLMVITPPDVHGEYEELGKKIGLKTSKFRLSASRMNNAVYNRGFADGSAVMNGRKLKSAS